MDMKDFLSFRRMVTPLIIQVIFWIGVGVCVIAGLVEIATGMPSRLGGGGYAPSGANLGANLVRTCDRGVPH